MPTNNDLAPLPPPSSSAGLHGDKKGETGKLGSLVEEFCAGDLAVLALVTGLADDDLNQAALASLSET